MVSDNNSSDDTAATIKEYTSIDARVEYHSCPHGGVPSTENFNRVFRLAREEFFMWASHNMLWDRAMLRQCVTVFEKNPKAVLVSPQCNIVDGQTGRSMRVDLSIDTQRLDSASRVSRYLTSDLSTNTIFYGLMRRKFASEFPLRIIFGADHVFIAELSFTGEFVTIPEVLMTKHTGGTSQTWTTIAEANRITNRWQKIFPWTAREYEMQKMILFRTPINVRKKLSLSAISFLAYLKWTKLYRILKALSMDVEHHILPIVFRYPKPFGTGTPIVLPKWLARFGTISDRPPNNNN
ncbi:glycosyltransferase family 2 protein [Gammaproteobacteria bacterium]|nr:glycosyltransferase family 2 protein [Gammaproteobacteria bacterium]